MTTQNLHDEKLFQSALADRDRRRPLVAIRKLKGLLRNKTDSAALRVVLGKIQWDRGDLREAFRTFLMAVKHQPDSRMASLGLFHLALELGKVEYAIKEGERFLNSHPSDRPYKKLVRDAAILYDLLEHKSKLVAKTLKEVSLTAGKPKRRMKRSS